jgi:hypothetical protein
MVRPHMPFHYLYVVCPTYISRVILLTSFAMPPLNTGLRYFVMNTKWYRNRSTACDDRRYSPTYEPYRNPPEGFA